MANKKVSQLTSKPSVLTTDLFPIADPSTGQLYKTTISDLGTAIGSGVSSVNGLVGAVVLDTDDIQELVSPTNKWFTDTRARAALSASSPLTYNSGTGVFGIQVANGSQNGYLSSADWTTFNAKQAALSGTGFVKISGTTISYDNSTYLTTSAAASTYVPYTGATANLDLGLNYSLTAASIIKSGGTSTQFLKADGSIDTNTYLTTSSAASTYVSGSGVTDYYARFTNTKVIADGFIRTTSNITYVEGMGLSTGNGLDIQGNYGAGGGGLKIRSYDETTGNAYIDFANTGGRMYLGLNRSTASGLMTNATAYATVLTTGLGTTNLEFGTNATKRLTIDGTTGALSASTSSGQSLTLDSTDTTLNQILFNRSGTTLGKVYLYYDTVNTRPEMVIGTYGTGGRVRIESGNNTTALTLDASQNAQFVGTISATGATLTGALSGTSATFSGGVVSNGGAIGYGGGELGFGVTSAGATSGIYTLATGSPILYFDHRATGNTGFWIWRSGTGGATTALTLSSAGAATFSSSVTAVSYVATGLLTAGLIGANTSFLDQTSSGTARWLSYGSNSSTRGAFSLYQASSANTLGQSVIDITSTGNVGIGTTSPSQKLDIYGRTRISNPSNSAQFLEVYTDGGSVYYNAQNNSIQNTAYQHIFFTDGVSPVERMRIKSNGIINLANVPTSSAGLSSGDVYKTVAGVLMIV